MRFLVGEAGIRQIIDIGTGIPSAGNVHQVAGELAAETRVVYVDNDRCRDIQADVGWLLQVHELVGTPAKINFCSAELVTVEGQNFGVHALAAIGSSCLVCDDDFIA